MGATWDAMQPAIAQLKVQADAADAKITDLEQRNAALQEALDECEAGGGPGPDPDRDLLLPPAGKLWMGCSYNGLQGHVAIVGKNPQIVHDYARSGSEFVGRLNRCPAGAIPLINFKPLGAMGPQAYKDILAGRGDAAIKVAADAMKARTKQMFFAPLHEPENDDKTGASDADYARAFRYVVEKVRSFGADPAVVWNMMGFEGHGARYDTLYPGDDVVDWIASDPYVRTVASIDTWAEFMDQPSGSIPGFYTWAKPKGKPFMLAEWGIGIAVAPTVAPKLLGSAQMTALQRDFPLCKALVYWNEIGTVDYRLQNFPAQWKAFNAMSQFNAPVP